MDEPESRDLDTVLTELTQVTEALLATPADDVERRLELQARRRRLRSEATRITGGGDAAGDLLERLRALEERPLDRG
jgi:hypothetical protein